MGIKKKLFGLLTAAAITVSLPAAANIYEKATAAESIESDMVWDTVTIGGGGFVSGIVAGQNEMYLRTDVGGAYRYNYDSMAWEQIFAFLNDADRGLLSVKGMAIDPTDDMTAYFLCGCAYFSDARTVIFKTTDGGETFTESDVTSMIQVHGNGDGRECIEPIAVDPDNPDIIYAGGDVTASGSGLIKSTDGGKTWKDVDGYGKLGLFNVSLKYPMWTDHMVMGTEDKEYNQQNGIGTILIEDGKVYVGTSVTGQTNIHVADVDKDEFTALSKDLPTANYPLSITSDKNGNIYFTYIAGLAFSGAAGGAYKYNKANGTVEELSVSKNGAIGMIDVSKDNPDKLLARTCGVWSDQWFSEQWSDDSIAWGDHFFRSSDGGKTWEDITPGAGEMDYSTDPATKKFVSLPMGTNGYDWIYGKACHWGSSIVLDPRNSDHIYMTSGNGVFRCDNVWDEKGVQFYFDPKGVEEVVSLDAVSVPGGNFFSAIGDYDGYEHLDVNEIGLQYYPNMGSTCAIAYCPQNPDIMLRIAEGDANNQATGYYSTDGGKTWTGMKVASGGKACITELSEGKYRFIKSGKESGSAVYSDDFGETWKDASGLKGDTKPSYFLVDPKDPSLIYASSIIYNQYWGSNPNVTEPTFDECHYSLFVSHDYGATWEENPVCKYDMCDAAGDPAYVTDGTIAFAAGWNGLYIITGEGKKIEKLENVSYCKTVGYGAPEKEGGVNSLYIYGKPGDSDPEGIYRSSDAGKTWVCINTTKLYGGTGNGNYLVGDMNEFGTVYMSTVGCGIVYGKLASNVDVPPTTKPTSPTKPTTTAPTTTKPEDVKTTVVTTATDKPATAATTDKPTTTKVSSNNTTAPGSDGPDVSTSAATKVTTAAPPVTSTTEEFPDPTLPNNNIPVPSGVKATRYGDVNLDGDIDIADTVELNMCLLDPSANPLKSDIAAANADVVRDDVLSAADSALILNYNAMMIKESELGKK